MTTAYADETYGNTYFAERLNSDAWDDATSANRVKALKQATRAIDNQNYTGLKNDEAQENQFPRGDDTVVPDVILQATCELALALLDGVDPNLEIENLSVTRQGIGDAKIERDTSYVQEHIRNGVPSIQAWILLKPFMLDPGNIDVSRG